MFEEIKFDFEKGSQSLESFAVKVRQWEADNYDAVVDSRFIGYKQDDSIRYTAHPVKDEGANGLFGENVQMSGGETNAKLTRHALAQLVERLDGPPTRWLHTKCDGLLRADVMNDVISHREAKDFLVRNRIQDDGTAVRAILSDQYGVFNHDEYIGLVQGAIDQMGAIGNDAIVFHGEIGDSMRGYVCLPNVSFGADPRNGGGHQLHPAVYIGNSETGTGKYRANGGLYSGLCENGYIFGWGSESALEGIHRNVSRRTIASQVADALAAAFRLSEEAAQRFVDSQAIFMEPNAIENLATKWGEKYGLTLESTEAWTKMIGMEARQQGRGDRPTLFDVVNAVTFTAQEQNPNEREVMERIGGDLLYAELPDRYLAI